MTGGGRPFDTAALRAAGRKLPAVFGIALHWLEAPEGQQAGAVELRCEAILRLLPGRRLVARVRLDGTHAVLKLFLGPGALRYWARERRGCERLRAAGVATPALLGSVAGADSARGLLLEYLPDATPLDPADQPGVEVAAAELARLHRSGCRHHDLHLDNFLAVPGRAGLCLIDGDGVRPAGQRPLGRRASVADLAVLAAQRPPLADAGLPGLWRAYATGRDWPDAADAVAALKLEVHRQRRARLRRYLAKAERDCSEFRCLRSWRQYLIAVRSAWDEALAALLADPEAAMAGARVLKAGNSATVVRAQLGAGTCVIKRYNLKGPWHALRRNLRTRPRFRIAWANGQRLHMLEIPTARPLALLERRFGPWRGVAYLVMEDVAADGASLDLATEVETVGLTEARLDQVLGIFRAMEIAGVVHGDTKASNFLVAGDRVHVVDLDAMAEGTLGRARDRRRFLANFDEQPAVRERFAAAFAAAGLDVEPRAR